LAAGHYTAAVKIGAWLKIPAMASALLVLGTGCGGLSAASSVSPLMFLLPAMAQTKPALPQPPVPGRTETNLPVALADQNLCDSRSR
jgi:hypothetical protein